MELTQARLKELVNYDPDTGKFCKVKNGAPMGHVKKALGYVILYIAGKQYLAHRVAVFYMTGRWPTEDTDHANGIRSDNRWQNVSAKSYSENQQNRGSPQKNNKTGFLGVRPLGGRFMGQITLNRKKHYLGLFGTPEEAHAAYMDAKRVLHTNSPRLLGQHS